MKKIYSIVAVLLVCVLTLSACTITLGDLGMLKYLSAEDITVAVGETKDIPYEASGLKGEVSFTTDSDCISIADGAVTGLKVGTAVISISIDGSTVEINVDVVEAESTAD